MGATWTVVNSKAAYAFCRAKRLTLRQRRLGAALSLYTLLRKAEGVCPNSALNARVIALAFS